MRDVLTEEECRELLTSGRWWRDALQAAARLGAERERERAARVCDDLAVVCGAADECAAAIRRGEGEQA